MWMVHAASCVPQLELCVSWWGGELSAASGVWNNLYNTLSLTFFLCVSLVPKLPSFAEVIIWSALTKREPPSWRWLDHLPYNLNVQKKLTYMWGPLLPKGELESCVHGWKWSLISQFDTNFNFWEALSQAFDLWKILFPLWKIKKEMCVCTHTHKKKKIKLSIESTESYS